MNNKTTRRIWFVPTLLLAFMVMSMVGCSGGNMTMLREAIDRAEEVDESDVTAASFAVLAEALADALLLYNEGGSNAEIREATLRLNRARNDLDTQNDFSELIALLDEELDSANFTAASFAQYNTARNRGQTVLADTGARQGQIDAVVLEIRRTRDLLVFIGSPERTELNELLTEVRALDSTLYTSRTFDPLMEELERAQYIYDDAGSGRNFITLALAELREVKSTLIPRGNVSALSQTITAVNSSHLTGLPDGRNPLNFYTPASFTAFNTIFEQAQSMVSNNDFSQQEIDALNNNLLAATANLVEWEGTGALVTLIESAQSYFDLESRFTVATMIVLRAAVGRAETTLETNYTAAQIIALEGEVSSAIAGMARIAIVANGNQGHSLRDRQFEIGRMSVTPRQYFREANRPGFLSHIRGLPQFRSETTIGGNNVITLANGLQITVGSSIFQATLPSVGAALTANQDIVSVLGIDFSMDRYDIYDSLGAPTFYETFERYGQTLGRLVYVDQSEGLEVVFEYHRGNGHIVRMAVVQS
ncbi:MAG: hypothetical protein FWB93_02960 [Oscillospiraceae bacterium]|nr:hypothetical protein [Oscillospiraceae bacterium]